MYSSVASQTLVPRQTPIPDVSPPRFGWCEMERKTTIDKIRNRQQIGRCIFNQSGCAKVHSRRTFDAISRVINQKSTGLSFSAFHSSINTMNSVVVEDTSRSALELVKQLTLAPLSIKKRTTSWRDFPAVRTDGRIRPRRL